MKPIIYTQRVKFIESYNERRDCADQNIPLLIEQCGFTPLPLPNNVTIVSKIIDLIHPKGIILTGGNSLVKYGGNAPERDEVDKFLINTAINKNIPLYGFCRGMQSILDYFDCKLTDVNGHIAVHHKIKGETGERTVNSYHSQGAIISAITLPLIATAISEDGIVEEIYHKEKKITATMWHPERENPFQKEDIEKIKELFE